MSKAVKWSDIKEECDGYRNGFVAVFRKYEGQDTDKKDKQGRTIKVSANSFAELAVGVTDSTFKRWIKNAETGAPLSGRPASGPTGTARSGQVGRQIAKSPKVSTEDKLGMLKDLVSDKAVLKAYREERAPTPPTPAEAKANRAVVDAFAHKINQSAVDLAVPMWLDWLKEITTNLAEYDFDEMTVGKLARAARKLMDEVEVQQFRLGLIDEGATG
jgi:hypothetical protein